MGAEEIRGNIRKSYDRLRVKAEKLFGPSVPDRPVVSFYFDPGPNIPQCQHLGRTDLSIRLTPSTKPDRRQQKFQLAHEVVHAICRGQKTMAPLIEEGAAVHFSYVVGEYPDGYLERCLAQSPPGYLVAADLYDQLIAVAPDAIQRIRAHQPVLDEVTGSDISQTVAGLTPGLVEALRLPLSRWQEAIDKGQADPERGRAAIRRWISLRGRTH